jgi:hypothetical protein
MKQTRSNTLSHLETADVNIDSRQQTDSHGLVPPFEPEIDPYTISKSRWRNGKKPKKGKHYRCRCDWCLPRYNRNQARAQFTTQLEDEYKLSVSRKAQWNSSPTVFSDWWWNFDDEFERCAEDEPEGSGSETDTECIRGGSSLGFVVGFEAYHALERENAIDAYTIIEREREKYLDKLSTRQQIQGRRRLAESVASVSSWLRKVLEGNYDDPEEKYDYLDWEVVSPGHSDCGSFNDWEFVTDS